MDPYYNVSNGTIIQNDKNGIEIFKYSGSFKYNSHSIIINKTAICLDLFENVNINHNGCIIILTNSVKSQCKNGKNNKIVFS